MTSSYYPSDMAQFISRFEDNICNTRNSTFLRMPLELRHMIFENTFAASPQVLDLDPSLFRLFHQLQILALFQVCRQLNFESTQYFFSTHTFRIFPSHPGEHFQSTKPLLARLPSRFRGYIRSLELRLGPGWNNPPPGWVVNQELGLTDCKTVRLLKIIVECDPTEPLYLGFVRAGGYYKIFSAELLDAVLSNIPTVKTVELNTYRSVKRDGGMMSELCKVLAEYPDISTTWCPKIM